jgi:hypothetical protein
MCAERVRPERDGNMSGRLGVRKPREYHRHRGALRFILLHAWVYDLFYSVRNAPYLQVIHTCPFLKTINPERFPSDAKFSYPSLPSGVGLVLFVL